MSDMKCPFCGKKLQLALNVGGREFYWCENYDCDGVNYGVGNKELWQKLIRTRKALDVAVDALEKIGSGDIIEHSVVGHEDDNKIFIANKALEQITELEQKDIK